MGKIWKVIMFSDGRADYLWVCAVRWLSMRERKWFPFLFPHEATRTDVLSASFFLPLRWGAFYIMCCDDVLCWLRRTKRKVKTTRILLFCHYFQFSLFNGSYCGGTGFSSSLSEKYSISISIVLILFFFFFQKDFPTVDVNGLFMFILGNLESFFWFSLRFGFI